MAKSARKSSASVDVSSPQNQLVLGGGTGLLSLTMPERPDFSFLNFTFNPNREFISPALKYGVNVKNPQFPVVPDFAYHLPINGLDIIKVSWSSNGEQTCAFYWWTS